MKKIISLIILSLIFYTILFAQTEKEFFDNGVLFFKQGQYSHAIDQFSRLIELNPENADAYKNRGVSYMKQEKFDLAIDDFERAKEIFPELKGLHSNLGVAWFYKKEYEKAIENYDIEIKMSPQNHIAYFNRALCLAELNRNAEALDDLSQTLELQPDFYLAICYKADLLAQQGETEKAVEAYEAAIRQTYASERMAELKEKIRAVKNTPPQQKKPAIKTAELKKDKPAVKMIEPPKPKPAIQKTEPPKPKPAIKTASNERYEIQAGAFLNPAYANRTKKEMLEYGVDSRILVLQDKKERLWYMVRSGDYATKAEAHQAMIALKKDLGINSVIRPFGSW